MGRTSVTTTLLRKFSPASTPIGAVRTSTKNARLSLRRFIGASDKGCDGSPKAQLALTDAAGFPAHVGQSGATLIRRSQKSLCGRRSAVAHGPARRCLALQLQLS